MRMLFRATKTRCHPSNPCNGVYGKCLDVKITNSCNGSCAFCIERGGYCPAPVSVDALVNMTNAMTDYRKVLILGGEPFLYPHLEEYIAGIRKKEVYITTNGSLFRTSALRRMAPHLTAVNISLHHHREEVNAGITGVHVDYGEIHTAVSLLRASGVQVRINANLIRGVQESAADLQQMIDLSRAIGASGIRFAELQGCQSLYLSARSFVDLPENPFANGCEHHMEMDGFSVTYRTTCGLCNPFLPAPVNPVRRGSMTKVLYPNGVVHDGWRAESSSQWRSPYNDICHSDGCHPCEPAGCH